jgi:hypothetical protein
LILSLACDCGGCLRGEMRCSFASPHSSISKLPRWMHALLESILDTHSSQWEAKMLLPLAVGLGLRYGRFSFWSSMNI